MSNAAKQLHFNKNGEALKKMQAGADKLATVVGVTLGPKVRLQPRAFSSGLPHAILHPVPNAGMHCIHGVCISSLFVMLNSKSTCRFLLLDMLADPRTRH